MTQHPFRSSRPVDWSAQQTIDSATYTKTNATAFTERQSLIENLVTSHDVHRSETP